MTEILTTYHINEQTMALQPTMHIDYSTLVLERGRELFVKQRPIEIINQSCLKALSSYVGRRDAVIYLTNSKRKVPIPIDPNKDIYTFPTQSPSQFNCSWVFYHHVHQIIPHPKETQSDTKSMIVFKNGQRLAMKESCYQLDRQMNRTAICILQFNSLQHHPFTI